MGARIGSGGESAGMAWARPGEVHSRVLGARASAGFQTGLERVGGMVDTLRPEHTLRRFGNRRSAKDWRMRLTGVYESLDLANRRYTRKVSHSKRN